MNQTTTTQADVTVTEIQKPKVRTNVKAGPGDVIAVC